MAHPLRQAVEHYRDGRISQAMRICRRLLADRPEDAEALNLIAALHYHDGRVEEAVGTLLRALLCVPASTLLPVNLGGMLQQAGQFGRAARSFRRLLLLDPSSAAVAERLGFTLQESGDIDGAIRHLRQAVRLGTEGAVTVNLGTTLMICGHLAEAHTVLREAVMLDPANAHGWATLAEAGMALGEFDAAEAPYRRADRLQPGHPPARNGLGRILRYRRAAANSEGNGRQGLVVRGQAAGTSGYAHMTERFLRGLAEQGVPLDEIGLFGEGRASPASIGARCMLNFMTPDTLEPVPGLPTVLFSMFEGTLIPPAWVRLSERADLVVVPTDSSRQAWAGRGFPEERLRVCPLGADPAPEETAPPLPLRTLDGRDVAGFRHRILNVSDLVARKNLDGLLRVWLRATMSFDDAVLILKPGKGGERTLEALEGIFRRAERAVGRSRQGAAPVAVVGTPLSDAAMGGLFRAATHYWSLSHGEGWDLPMTRAGAMGLQLIAPRHSAYLDYLDDTIAHMIPARVGPALDPLTREPWPPFFGLDWWNPDEDVATALLSAIVRGDRMPVLDARSRLLERFGWHRATARLTGILHDAGLL